MWTPDFDPSGSRIVRNLTTKQYGIQIPAGESETLPYNILTNMHPAEFRLNLAAVLSKGTSFFTQQAFNGTVQVVEPDSSIFDPQMYVCPSTFSPLQLTCPSIFLYFFLLACTGGIGYLFYNLWVAPYFPQKKKSKAKAPVKKIEAVGETPATDSPAVATGAKPYAEEWIPSHHLQRPEAKRVKSGSRPKSRQG